MITVIARFKFQEGQEEAGLEALRTMTNSVKENESGALSYICHRDQEDPSQIVFFEVYKDEEAFAAHRKTDHM